MARVVVVVRLPCAQSVAIPRSKSPSNSGTLADILCRMLCERYYSNFDFNDHRAITTRFQPCRGRDRNYTE